MASLSGPTNPFPPPVHRRLDPAPARIRAHPKFKSDPDPAVEQTRVKERERREEVNRKIASQKAISIILRREATKAVIEKKRGPNNSKKLLPRTVLEALHERITALRWESALKVFELLREQLWYRPNSGIYIKLIVMLGKCKQPERAHALFQAMVDEGCVVNHESFTALLSAYSRSGLFDKAFSLLELMKNSPNCKPDVYTYSILIKSCLQVFAFDKVDGLLSDMASQGIKPSTITYNTLIDAYGKAKKVSSIFSFNKRFAIPCDVGIMVNQEKGGKTRTTGIKVDFVSLHEQWEVENDIRAIPSSVILIATVASPSLTTMATKI